MLLEKIKKDLLNEMKSKDTSKRDFLKVIVGDINRLSSKNINDDDVIKVLKTLYENAKFMNNSFEMNIISEYLPTMLTIEDVSSIVKTIIEENNITKKKQIGILMKTIKMRSDSGLINMQMVNEAFSKLIT